MELDKPIETTTDYPESLFGDDPIEETTDTPTVEDTNVEETNEKTETTTTEEKTDAQQMLKVKYNGETKEITLEEAITLAQKGMNYDKKVSELDSLKNSRQMKVIERLANQANLSIDDYLDSVERGFEEQSIAKITNELTKKYPNADNEALQELAKAQYALIMQENQKKAEQEARQKAESERDVQKEQDERLNAMISEFMEIHPDVDLEKELQNEEFIKLVDKGQTLVGAYNIIENQRLKQAMDAMKQNEKNSKKATGSISGNSQQKIEDAFLSGFLD